MEKILKISVITAVYNRADTIGMAVESLKAQTHSNFEHLVFDAVSTDETIRVVEKLADKRTSITSGPDEGIYDALNKGKSAASGEVIGVLHSDDFFASPYVFSQVSAAFKNPKVDAVFGDLHYIAKDDPERVIRNWRSGEFHRQMLARGWMPPHPALFLRRRVIEQYGLYDPTFQISADYDAILRYFSQPGFKAVYIPEVFVKMRIGGESNRSIERILRKSREDYRAIRKNGVGGVGTLVSKNLRKVGQFLPSSRS